MRKYSAIIYLFFKNSKVNNILSSLIIISVIVAIFSIIKPYPALDTINLAFSLFFIFEILTRYFSYDNKKQYLRDWIIDFLAVVPWEPLLLYFIDDNVNLYYLRMLRLPRTIRLFKIFNLRNPKFLEKIYYFTKKQIQKSILSQITVLIFATTFLVLTFGTIFTFLGVKFDQGNSFWFSILSLLGPDALYTISNEGGTVKFMSLILSITGLIIFNGIIIAIIVAQIQKYLIEIKEGKGAVIEKNYILILGWSDIIPYLLNEIETYCYTERKIEKIVILTDSLREENRDILTDRSTVEVIYRTGEPFKLNNLKNLKPENCKSVVIFGSDSSRETDYNITDSRVIKTYLSLYSIIKNNEKIKFNCQFPLTLLNFQNISNSHYLTSFRDKNALFLNQYFYSAKLLFLFLINFRLYYVFNELLSYSGSEFHFYQIEKLTCRSFGDIFLSFKTTIPIGVYRKNEMFLIPQPGFEIKAGDQIVTLAVNDDELKTEKISISYDPNNADTYKIAQNNNEFNFKKKPRELKNKNAKIAIIGLNNRLPYIIEEIIKINIKASIFGYCPPDEFYRWYKENIGQEISPNITYSKCAFENEKDIIEKINLAEYSNIIILADEYELNLNKSDKMGATKIDTDSLFKLLKIIHIKKTHISEENDIKIIIEIMETENEEIMNNIPDCVYIIGNLLFAKIINMTLWNPQIIKVFDQLLQKGGVEVEVKKLADFIPNDYDKQFKFSELLENFYFKDETIVIGLIRKNAAKNDYETLINPNKDEIIYPDDRIIYLEKSDIEYQKFDMYYN